MAKGTVRMAAANSKLPHSPDTFDNSEFPVKKVAERYAVLAESTRGCINVCDKLGDRGTANLFTEISRGIDKGLYFLDSHLN